MKTILLALSLAFLATPTMAQDTSPAKLIEKYSLEAGMSPSIEAVETFFLANHGTGKPKTPSCVTCHTGTPTKAGKTRTGKAIEPLAPSVNSSRFTDNAFVEKWFGRNCKSVLGRPCSSIEKANIIDWLVAQ